MKKVYYILFGALVVITACMVSLVFKGVSLRTEPIIKPSVVDINYDNIAFGIFHRLFPEFQKTDYVVWGIDLATSAEEAKIFLRLQSEYKKQFHQDPQIINVHSSTEKEGIKNCKAPCWIVVDKKLASALPINSILKLIQAERGNNYFSISFSDFELEDSVPTECESEQRLEYACMRPISVRESRKYMKKPEQRYFFMRRYNEVDYFLFIEKSAS